jgi:hypothetical protein
MGDRLDTATHEAGHAVVALALGIDVKLATILRAPGSVGRVELIEPDAGSLEDRAMVRLAGERAMVAFGLYPDAGCLKDLSEARTYALTLTGGDESRTEDILGSLRVTVDDLIFEHGLEIGDVSVALLERSTLTGAELRAVLETRTTLKGLVN